MAAPRRRMNPVPALVVLALIPAAGLFALHRWSDSKADAAEAAPVPSPPGAMTPLATPLLSLRRTPETLAQDAAVASLRSALVPVSALVGETSCLSVDIGTRPVIALGATTPVIPASNMKLLTGAVALEVLGADFRYTTELRGVLDNGVVTGDLYFVGGGDPLLSTAAYPATQKYPPFSTTSLEVLVYNLAIAGVKQISGNIVADESRYDTERSVPSWASGLVGVEAGPLSALMVNDGVRDLGNMARYADVAQGAASELRALLREAGIGVGGQATLGVTPPGTPPIAAIQSEPFSAVLAEMMTTSDNNSAELILKELGVKAGTGGTRTAGLDVVRGVLATWNIDVSAMVLQDGSGLDSGNLLSCSTLVDVIQHEHDKTLFTAALPIAGQTGTLADELGDSPLAGNIQAKTGSLTNVKALSGIATTPQGRVDFALVLNAAGANDEQVYRPVWAALSQALATGLVVPPIEQLLPR